MRNISASSRVTSRLVAPLTILALLAIWQLVCSAGLVPPFMLPSPIRVVQALVGDWPLLVGHAATSLAEAGLGLAAGVALGFIAALAMDQGNGEVWPCPIENSIIPFHQVVIRDIGLTLGEMFDL